jgi:hypothetical protein
MTVASMPHVVARDAVHAGSSEAGAPKKVAPADDDADLDAELAHGTDLVREPLQELRIDTVIGVAHEGFTGQLDHDAAMSRLRVV